MYSASLLTMTTLHLVAAIFFALTARSILRRDFTPDVRGAGIAFVIAWAMLAVMAGSDGLRILVALLTQPDLALYQSVVQIGVVATAVMIAGFGYYVLFILTGKHWIAFPLMAYAIFHAFFYLYRIQLRVPTGVEMAPWSTAMTFEAATASIVATPITTYVTFYAPPVILALLFISLLFRFGHPSLRFRAVATAAVIILYHAIHYLRFAPALQMEPLAKPLLALLVAMGAVVAWYAHRLPLSERREPQAHAPTHSD